ncbi:MAG: glycosyltransferase [bacterium]|nr:glycosyltransferase [bacterium]
MKKLRVGIWLDSSVNPRSGGGYSYLNELSEALAKYPFKDAEVVFLSDKENIFSQLGHKTITWEPRKVAILKKLLKITITLNPFNLNPLLRVFKKTIERKINKNDQKLQKDIYRHADIVYYLTPGVVHHNISYIYTFWDVGHISSYAFPEFTKDIIFEKRTAHYDVIPRKALMVFTESEAGKKECEKYLNIKEDKIKVVPIFPSGVVVPKCKSSKPERMAEDDFFIHYSAQYWAHKNHYNLLVAMCSVVKMFPKIKLVLTGSDKGNKKYILKTITDLKLENNVIDLGFVSLEELRWLYNKSQGLVMPTLLGPTNMPLLEAAELDCPVACTNLPGHVEQLGNYGYYFDGLDPDDIANQIMLMLNDKKDGKVKKYYDSKFNINNALKAIDEAFSTLKRIRSCWGGDYETKDGL